VYTDSQLKKVGIKKKKRNFLHQKVEKYTKTIEHLIVALENKFINHLTI